MREKTARKRPAAGRTNSSLKASLRRWISKLPPWGGCMVVRGRPAAPVVNLAVPLVADAGIGDTWDEAHQP